MVSACWGFCAAIGAKFIICKCFSTVGDSFGVCSLFDCSPFFFISTQGGRCCHSSRLLLQSGFGRGRSETEPRGSGRGIHHTIGQSFRSKSMGLQRGPCTDFHRRTIPHLGTDGISFGTLLQGCAATIPTFQYRSTTHPPSSLVE